MFQAYIRNGETWLICGGRDFTDMEMFRAAIGDIMTLRGCPDRVIHGAARGADMLADEWARSLALDVTAVPADWERHGKAAGPIRNQEMLAMNPHAVVAFPGGRGTANMVGLAKAARAAGVEIDVIEIKPARNAEPTTS